MRWPDAVQVASRDVSRRKARVSLTVVAVALAATLLTALLLIADTAKTRVLDQLAKGGPLAGIRVATEVSRDDVEAMRRLPDVDAVLPVLATEVRVLSIPDEPTPTTAPGAPTPPAVPAQIELRLVGADLRQPGKLPITVLAGRLPGATSRTEVAVTQELFERLGITEQQAATLIGREVVLRSDRFQGRNGPTTTRSTRAAIVGVVAQEAARGDLIAPLPVVERTAAWARPRRGLSYDGAFVVALRLDRVAPARQQLSGLGFASTAPENLIASVQRYLHVVEIVLGAIGLIALVIAGLGIANALFASVRERRQEIGVLKAIGARDRDVRRVFLIEAAALGFVGGTIGTFLGWLVSRLVAAVVNGYLSQFGLRGAEVALPWRVVVAGILGSTVLALVAGTLPAARAARLPARQALSDL